MTSKERAKLRAQANTLEPIIQIGKEGITSNLISQIDDTLDTRELLKVKVHLETAPLTPKEIAPQLADALKAEVIQVIGGVIVLYREIDEKKIEAKKKQKQPSKAKAKSKKKVKIKGLRERQKEKEQKNPYAVYERPRYKGDRDKKQGRK